MGNKNPNKFRTVSVNIPERHFKGLNKLVSAGLYTNRSEAIRMAVRDLLTRELSNGEVNLGEVITRFLQHQLLGSKTNEEQRIIQKLIMTCGKREIVITE